MVCIYYTGLCCDLVEHCSDDRELVAEPGPPVANRESRRADTSPARASNVDTTRLVYGGCEADRRFLVAFAVRRAGRVRLRAGWSEHDDIERNDGDVLGVWSPSGVVVDELICRRLMDVLGDLARERDVPTDDV